jgi:hypothetical protein
MPAKTAPAATAADPPFMDVLPQGCPPGTTAKRRAVAEAWRFVNSNPPADQDFWSFAKLKPNKPPPATVTPCQWAGSSLFVTKGWAFKKLPKCRDRFNYIIKIEITENCGFTELEIPHIRLWRFKSFKPKILLVEGL